jgi:hypothetical protein
MSVSSFFGALAAQFAQDLLFKRPITVELTRDANGFKAKASINPSGGSAPLVYPPWGYAPPPPYGYMPPPYPGYGYAPPPPPQHPAQAPGPNAPVNRVRPFVLPEEFRA